MRLKRVNYNQIMHKLTLLLAVNLFLTLISNYVPRVRCQQQLQCPAINLPPYGRYLRGQCLTSFGSACYVGCQPNFDLLGSCYRVCGNNGSWTGVPVACVRTSIQCPRIVLPQNVMLMSGCQNNAGFECTFGCVAGTLNGYNSIFCQVNGQWSGPVPSCVGGGTFPPTQTPPPTPPPTPTPQCQQLYPPLNGNFLGGLCTRNVGAQCTVVCSQGFRISGTNPVVCLATGWSSPLAQCTQSIGCPPLAKPVNGNNYGTCNNQAIPGQTCTFTCDPGYQLTASGALTCGATGSWNPPTPPSCNRYSCPQQNPPYNGQISGQCIPGIVNEVCNFNCFPGYRRVGNQAITCQSNGAWSGQAPLCQPDGCGNLPVPIGGFWETNGGVTLTPCPGTPGATCKLICSQGYILQGTPTTTCQGVGSNYQWTPQVGTCVATNAVSAKLVRSRLRRETETERTTPRPKRCIARSKTGNARGSKKKDPR